MGNIIEVNGLVKSFENKVALKNVSFSIKKGETFGLLGPSGSGKTTTIKILTSQLFPSAGEVKIFNEPLNQQTDSAYKRRFGILTDNSGLYTRLSIQDNLHLYCQLYEVPTKRIDEVLQIVNLQDDRKKVISKLSKGMKQRVLLARAILHKPDLLFLDEPTSALDPTNTKHIHAGLKQLNEEGTTIFLTTHNMLEAESLCDRVAFLHDGEIQLADTPKNVRLRYAEPTIKLLLKDKRTIIVPKDHTGAEKIEKYLSTGELLTIHSNEPTLGDIFVQLTGRNLA